MRAFVEFRAGTDMWAAEGACRAEGMKMVSVSTGPASPNGGVRVEGDIAGGSEAFRDAVMARMPGAVEYAGLGS